MNPSQSTIRRRHGGIEGFRAFFVQFLGVRARQISSHILIAPVVYGVTFQRLFERGRERELIDGVDGGSGDDDFDGDILQRKDAGVGFEQAGHPVTLQGDAREFGERLDDVEVAQRRHFEEGHVTLGGVMLCQRLAHLTFVSQMKTVSHQDLRYSRSMLIDLACLT